MLTIIRSIMNNNEKRTVLLSFMETEILSDEAVDETSLEDNHLEQIPEKYRNAVKNIADYMSATLISYFNPKTLEIEFEHKDAWTDSLGEDDEEDLEDGNRFEWEKCVTIEPLDSRESYEIMEDFVNHLKDKKESSKLSQALNGAKPFANFNHLIHNSDCREDWFAFRQRELEKYVIKNYFSDIEELES